MSQTPPAATWSADAAKQVDAAADQALKATGVPSASVAVVVDNKVVYLHAYGDARVEPKLAAAPEMRYSIGSISKQFCSTAVLMLAEQGKLSLDDKVAKYIPDLTRANEVTIRELLSHTSGYQDYWPQDYVMPEMLQPTTAKHILDKWARIPLDFDPGTKWQYSNTNYVIAGMIVEKVSGMKFLDFLSKNIFTPLQMKSVMNIDEEHLTQTDATGYTRYALGPPRVAPKEGKGWLFAAGELAMPASDLAKWDIAMIEQKLLKPESYRQQQTEVLLKNGLATGYGLGIDVGKNQDPAHAHRALNHGGEVSGFTSENVVFPDDRAAIVVLTNQDAAGAAGQIADSIATALFPPLQEAAPEITKRYRAVYEGLQQGKIDRSLFTDNANFYFSDQAIQDFATSLGPLGVPDKFVQAAQGLRGGMTLRRFVVRYPKKTLVITCFEMPDGKIEQFQVAARE
jgi:CubicO group peptidase (beta-lactamase class C family)